MEVRGRAPIASNVFSTYELKESFQMNTSGLIFAIRTSCNRCDPKNALDMLMNAFIPYLKSSQYEKTASK